MYLYLVRHGQSYVNLSEWTGGNRDTGLTDLGRAQATALTHWLISEVPCIDVVFASTLRRAMETANYIARAYRVECIPDTRLREIGCNRFDNEPWPNDDLPPYSDHWIEGNDRPFAVITPEREAGESYMHFRTRTGAFVEEILNSHINQSVVAVCHGAVIECIFDNIFNVGPWRHCATISENTGVTCFHYNQKPQNGIWQLNYHNRAEHLKVVEAIPSE